jgi:ribosomal protein L37AE/L43A
MGADSWTRTGEERRWQARARAHENRKKTKEPIADRIRGRLAGERKCHSCNNAYGSRFRAGSWVCKSCSHPKLAGGRDRTPPRRGPWNW